MAVAIKRGIAMENKRVKISSKRQITIPLQFYERLDFADEAEFILQDDTLILRPVKNDGEDFSEQILADLLAQGYSGEELLQQFKLVKAKMRPAVKEMIADADSLAKAEINAISLDELFQAEE